MLDFPPLSVNNPLPPHPKPQIRPSGHPNSSNINNICARYRQSWPQDATRTPSWPTLTHPDPPWPHPDPTWDPKSEHFWGRFHSFLLDPICNIMGYTVPTQDLTVKPKNRPKGPLSTIVLVWSSYKQKRRIHEPGIQLGPPPLKSLSRGYITRKKWLFRTICRLKRKKHLHSVKKGSKKAPFGQKPLSFWKIRPVFLDFPQKRGRILRVGPQSWKSRKIFLEYFPKKDPIYILI